MSSRRPSVASVLPETRLRHWLQHTWIGRLPLPDWRGWREFLRSRDEFIPPRRRPWQLYLESLERRWVVSDPLGVMPTALLGAGLLLSPLDTSRPEALGGPRAARPTTPGPERRDSARAAFEAAVAAGLGPAFRVTAAPEGVTAPALAATPGSAAASGSSQALAWEDWLRDPLNADWFRALDVALFPGQRTGPRPSPEAAAGDGPTPPGDSGPDPLSPLGGPPGLEPPTPLPQGGSDLDLLAFLGGNDGGGRIAATLSVTAQDITVREGEAFTLRVATFTYSEAAVPADFTATINWNEAGRPARGPTNYSVGEVRATFDGFEVIASHTYKEQENYSFTVRVKHRNGVNDERATAAATVQHARPRVSATPIRTVEGVLYSGGVAWFVDPGPGTVASNFRAEINWGEGSPEPAEDILPNGQDGFIVYGTHRYSVVGEYTVSVKVWNNAQPVLDGTGTTKAVVSNAPLQGFSTVLTASEGVLFNGPVATFTDPNPWPAYIYTSTIDWGDDTPLDTTAVITGPVGGTYTVTDNHRYVAAGVYVVTVQVRDLDGSSTTLQTSAVVSDSPPALTDSFPNIIEGQQFVGEVVTFTDPDPEAQTTDFIATITWEPGVFERGAVGRLGPGTFSVTGSYTFRQSGPKTVSVRVDSAKGGTNTLTRTVTVQEASFSMAQANATAYKGMAFNGVVARFTDTNPLSLTGDYTATVTLLPSTPLPATIVPLGGGAFEVTTSHTFPEVRGYDVRVRVRHLGRSQPEQEMTSTVTVQKGDYLRARPAWGTVTPVEGQSWTGELARFNTNNTAAQPGDFTVTVNWGDLEPDSTVIPTPSGGEFIVSGTRTYKHLGAYTITVTVTDGTNSTSVTMGALVRGSAWTGHPRTLSVEEGRVFGWEYPDGVSTDGIVATFTDPNPDQAGSDYTVLIDWGNGNVSRGWVTRVGVTNVYEVRGYNMYPDEMTTTVKVFVSDRGTSRIRIDSPMTVRDATLRAERRNGGIAYRGWRFEAEVAYFWDGPFDLKTEFTATINWGDGGGDEPATIRGGLHDWNWGPYGYGYYACGYYYYTCAQFIVDGSHTYQSTGEKTLTVTIRDGDREERVVYPVFTVYEPGPPLSYQDPRIEVSVQNVTVTEIDRFAGTVATFTDSGYEPGDTYSAYIDWGAPGQLDTDVVEVRGNTVYGEHTYTVDGTFPLRVTVSRRNCVNACTPSAYNWGDGTATVHDRGRENITLTANGRRASGTEGQALNLVEVARFKSGRADAASTQFRAWVTWGDSTPEEEVPAAQIQPVDGSPGEFAVLGSHTYANAGNYLLTVRVRETLPFLPRETGSPMQQEVAAYGTVQVANPPFTDVLGIALTATAAQPFTNVLVATFRDPHTTEIPGNYAVTIHWGNGQTTSGAVTNLAGGLREVRGSSTYDYPGNYATRVVIRERRAHGSETPVIAVASAAATVTGGDPPHPDRPRVEQALPFTGTEGQTVNREVARFRLPASAQISQACNSATIEWGDTQTSAGRLTSNGDGTFSVNGDHVYAEQGSYGVIVTFKCWTGEGKAFTTATIADRTLRAQAAALPVSTAIWGGWDANWWTYWVPGGGCWYYGCDYYFGPGWDFYEDTTGLNDVVVATFTDEDMTKTVTSYTATIHWGDGSSTSGTIVRGPDTVASDSAAVRQFYVVGSHRYSFRATYTVAVDVLHRDMDNSVQVAHVTTTATAVEAAAGQPAFYHVASFRNKNYLKPFIWSSVNWGDGSPTYYPSAGWSYWGGWYWGFYGYYWGYWGWRGNTINVPGTHIYFREGSYTPTATAYTRNHAISGGREIQVADGPLLVKHKVPVVNAAVNADTGLVTLANLVDLDPAGTAAGKRVKIDWGDGTPTETPAGAVVVGDDGSLLVRAGHRYTKTGSYTIFVQIEAADKEQPLADGKTTFTTTARVINPNLALQVNDFGALENVTTGEVALATLTGVDDVALLRATIEWGGSGTGETQGKIRASGPGTYTVYGEYRYTQAGTYPFKVRVAYTDNSYFVKGEAKAHVRKGTTLTPQHRTGDPERLHKAAYGEAAVGVGDGSLRLSHPLDFDLSPGTATGGSPTLVYNSATVSAAPIVEVLVKGNFYQAPTQAEVILTWAAGNPQEKVTFNLPAAVPPAGYTLAAQVASNVTATGLYPWKAQVRFLGAGPVVTAQVSGTAAVVVRDDSPLGAGWGITGLDTLVPDCDGNVLWVYGGGDVRVFTRDYDSGEEHFYRTPSEDFGTLKRNRNTNVFTYTAKDTTRSTFDNHGRLQTVRDPRGLTLTYQYDAQGRPQRVQSPDGGETVLAYPAGGVTITEPGNRAVQLTLVGGDLQSIRDVDYIQSTRTFSYDSHRLTRDQWPPLDATFRYDTTHRRLDQIDRGPGAGVGSAFYDVKAAAVQGLGRTGSSVAVGQPGVGTVADGLGKTATFTLDTRGRTLKIERPLGWVERFARNDRGQVTVSTDPLGRPTTHTYDAVYGDLTRTDYPDGTNEQYQYYGTFHYLTRRQDGRGYATEYEYDDLGQLTTVTNARYEVMTYAYYSGSKVGLVRAVTDGRGYETLYDYDANRRLQVTVEPGGYRTTQAYDAAGNLWTTKDALDRLTTYVYDGRNQLRSMTDAAGGVTVYDYNPYGQMIRRTDPKKKPADTSGKVTEFGYDRRGWQERVEEGVGVAADATRTDMLYDAAGNLVSKTTGQGAAGYANPSTTTYMYDDLYRQTRRTEAAGTADRREIVMVYNLAGNVILAQNGRGVFTGYDYDARNRPRAVYEAWAPWPTDLFLSNYWRLTRHQYDAAGNVVRTSRGGRVIGDLTIAGSLYLATPQARVVTSYDYDQLNRLTTTVEALGRPEARTTERDYDRAGNILWERNGRGVLTSYAYDARNLRTAVYEGYITAGSYDRLTTMAYDPVRNLSSTRKGMSTVYLPRISITSYGYDRLNRVNQVLENWAAGPLYDRRTEREYDGAGNLVRETTGFSTNLTPHLSTTVYDYDMLNRRRHVWAAAGEPEEQHTIMSYDAAGNLARVTTGLGERGPVGYSHPATTSYVYDGLNRRRELWEAVGEADVQRRTTYLYDAADNLVSITRYGAGADTRRVVTEHAYDSLNQRMWTAEARNSHLTGWAWNVERFTQFLYDGHGNPIITLAGNAFPTVTIGTTAEPYRKPLVVAQTFDPLGRKVAVTESDEPAARLRRSWMAYDAADNLVEEWRDGPIDSFNGVRTSMVYDWLNRRTQTFENYRNPFDYGRATTTVYDALDNVRSVATGDAPVRPHIVTTAFDYNVLGWKKEVIEAAGRPEARQTTLTYDAAGNVRSLTSGQSDRVYDDNWTLVAPYASPRAVYGLAETTEFTYDKLNRRVQTIEAANGPLRRTNVTQHDAANNLWKVTDAYNRTTTNSYDGLNRRTQVAGPAGDVTRTSYDAFDNARETRDGMGFATLYDFDALGRRTKEVLPYGWYDAQGNFTPAPANVQRHTTMLYDAQDNLRFVLRSNATITHLYDDLNRRVRTVDANGGDTFMRYDLADRIIQVSDPNSNLTRYVYNAMGQRTEIIDPHIKSQVFWYDAAGNPRFKWDRRGLRQDFEYDGLGRQVNEWWYARDGVEQVGRDRTRYDAQGNTLFAENSPQGAPSYAYESTYNVLNRVTFRRMPFGTTMSYLYNTTPAGNPRTEIRDNWQGGGYTILGYNTADRLDYKHIRTGTAVGASEYKVWFYYNLNHELTNIQYRWPDSSLVAEGDYLYDDYGRGMTDVVEWCKVSGPSCATLQKLDAVYYDYDSMGRLYEEDRRAWDGTGSYNNGFSHRLISSYDPAHQQNREVRHEQSGAIETVTYDYDPANNRRGGAIVNGRGNRLVADASRTYSHDDEGNIVRFSYGTEQFVFQYDHKNRVTRINWLNGDSVNGTLTYSYDIYGRRMTREQNGNPVQWYIYEGSDHHTWAQYDTSWGLRRFIRGEGGELYGRHDTVLGDLWYLTDKRGSVLTIVRGSDRDIRKRVKYNGFAPYGIPIDQGVQDRFGYTGKEMDYPWSISTFIEMAYDQGRWYHPPSGRWLSEDPRGLEADLNPYRFEENQPTKVDYHSFQVVESRQEREEKGVGEPGFAESLIPVWGSGRASLNHFQNGRWGWGLFEAGMAVVDVAALVGSVFSGGAATAGWTAVKTGLKAGLVTGVKTLAKQTAARALTTQAVKAIGKVAAVQAGKGAVGGGYGAFQAYVQGGDASKIFEAGYKGFVRGLLDPTRGTLYQAAGGTLGFTAGTYVDMAAGGDGSRGAYFGMTLGEIGGGLYGSYQFGSSRPCTSSGSHAAMWAGLKQVAPDVVGGSIGGATAWLGGGDFDSIVEGIHFGQTVADQALMVARWSKYLQACFATGTPLLTPDGEKLVEQFRAGDLVLSRSEMDPEGPVEAQVVEEVFVRTGKVLHLHVGERVIRTTPEHPFWVQGKGWVAAGALKVGDRLSSHDGQWVAVEDLLDTGEYEIVYNLRVREFHTYFVGGQEWEFSVWAHNDECSRKLAKSLEEAGRPAPAGVKAEPAHVVPVLRDGGTYSQRPKEVRAAIQQARKALEDVGIDINSAPNGFWATGGRSHMGTHRNKFFLEIGPQLENAAAQGKEVVEAELAKIITKSEAGTFRGKSYKGK